MSKCAVMHVVRGKRHRVDGLELPSGEVMKDVDQEGYKYLGILQTDVMMTKEMKKKVAPKVAVVRRQSYCRDQRLGNRNCPLHCRGVGMDKERVETDRHTDKKDNDDAWSVPQE